MLGVRKAEKRIAEIYIFSAYLFKVIFDIFGITCNNGAVETAVRVLYLLMLVSDTGIENKVYALVYQKFYMAVHKLCGIAHGLARYGFYTKLVNTAVCFGRKSYAVAEFVKESEPQRIVLVHIEYAGNTHNAAFCLVGVDRLVAEKSVVFIVKKVGNTAF